MFEKIEKFVACACVAVMAVLVFANVVARFVFKHSLAVSDEMSTYLFVLMSFMGTAIAARRRTSAAVHCQSNPEGCSNYHSG